MESHALIWVNSRKRYTSRSLYCIYCSGLFLVWFVKSGVDGIHSNIICTENRITGWALSKFCIQILATVCSMQYARQRALIQGFGSKGVPVTLKLPCSEKIFIHTFSPCPEWCQSRIMTRCKLGEDKQGSPRQAKVTVDLTYSIINADFSHM